MLNIPGVTQSVANRPAFRFAQASSFQGRTATLAQRQGDQVSFTANVSRPPRFAGSDEQNKEKILDILKTQKLAVISTSGPASPTPESALVAFVEDDQLRLYFQTGKHTRKAENLQANPHVSFVIGLKQEDMVTVQYEGKAEQIQAPEEIEACKQRFRAKDSPATDEYLDHPTAIFFKVTPTWIGCSDYSGEVPDVIEIKRF
ncbi:MAG TPA: pyridoxamine 5'-phosphate oxidase family protein [Oculatellaceae cyanobacterium]